MVPSVSRLLLARLHEVLSWYPVKTRSRLGVAFSAVGKGLRASTIDTGSKAPRSAAPTPSPPLPPSGRNNRANPPPHNRSPQLCAVI